MTTTSIVQGDATTRVTRSIAVNRVRVIDRSFGSETTGRIGGYRTTQVPGPDMEVVTPMPIPPFYGQNSQNTKPIQIWEGEVLALDREASTMSTRLRAKMGSFSEHNADIALEWVHEQDLDLIKAGAIF